MGGVKQPGFDPTFCENCGLPLVLTWMVKASEDFPVVYDRVDPARAAALMATIGLAGEAPNTGDPLWPFFHQIYFWNAVPTENLGEDGHAATKGAIPIAPGAHRLWAGGRVVFHTPFCAGIAAHKSTTLKDVSQKSGRRGDLTFVTLNHSIQQGGKPAISEDQVLVYRTNSTNQPDPIEPQPRVAEFRLPVDFPPTRLFRYSALTFNAHRIHYDLEYCRQVCGYPGLVVHGPLMAQYLALFASERIGRLASFSYRAHSPLICGEAAELCSSGLDFWLEGPQGRLCMTAAAVPVA